MTDKEILNLAQAELRAMYKRLEIKGSNILDLIDKAIESRQLKKQFCYQEISSDRHGWGIGIIEKK